MGLPRGRRASRLLLFLDTPGLGAASRPAHLQPGPVGLLEVAGPHLPHCFRVALGADPRPGGQQRHPAGVLGDGRHATQCGRRTPRPEPLPPRPDVMLVQNHRRLPDISMRRRSDAGRPAHRWRGPCPVSVPALVNQPFADYGLPGVPELSMGHPAVGNGLPGHLPGALAIVASIVPRPSTLAPRFVAVALAVVQTDVPIRLRQTAQRRFSLAQWVSAAAMFGIELLVPFLIFAPRRPRQFTFIVLVVFQTLIFLTGNYCFFNLLTVALCLLLLDRKSTRL